MTTLVATFHADTMMQSTRVTVCLLTVLVCAPAVAVADELPSPVFLNQQSGAAVRAETHQPEPSFAETLSGWRNSIAERQNFDLRGQAPMEFGDWPRFWASSEILLWWRKGMRFPALVTDNAATPTVLFGNDRLSGNLKAGGRFTLGGWFSEEKTTGFEATFLGLGRDKHLFNSGSTGVVVRPFNLNGVPNVLLVNSPPDPLGFVTVTTTSDIYGGNASFRRMIRGDAEGRLDFLLGYQIWRIEESATIQHQFVSGGNSFQGTDRFSTENEFHGVDLGLVAAHRGERVTVELLLKLGLGNMHQRIEAFGSNPAGTPPALPNNASLLVRQSNFGTQVRNDFTSSRQIGINFGYRLTPNVEVRAGYSMVYWQHVAQPGEQIDLNLPNPQLLLKDGGYFVHGTNFMFIIGL